MLDEKSLVMEGIRQALSAREDKVPLPDYEPKSIVAKPRLRGEDPWDDFDRQFTAVNGRVVNDVATLAAWLLAGEHQTGYCDPALRRAVGDPLSASGLTIHYTYEREHVERYQFGITLGSGAIAETGTLILNDFDTADRMAALSPWVHVAVLRPDQVISTLAEALENLGTCPNVIWCTGPSKTADIEGILIEGVHGPGEQLCLRLA